MQIEERVVGNVTILDLKGKLIAGDGDSLLKDKIHSLLHQGRKHFLLNLGDVPSMDSAGIGQVVSYVYDGQPAGRHPEAAEPDQAHPRSCSSSRSC